MLLERHGSGMGGDSGGGGGDPLCVEVLVLEESSSVDESESSESDSEESDSSVVVKWVAMLEDVPSDFWAELTIMREVTDWDCHFPRNVV